MRCSIISQRRIRCFPLWFLLVVSQNRGTQYRPQNITIVIIGTPKLVPPILGNPHLLGLSLECSLLMTLGVRISPAFLTEEFALRTPRISRSWRTAASPSVAALAKFGLFFTYQIPCPSTCDKRNPAQPKEPNSTGFRESQFTWRVRGTW